MHRLIPNNRIFFSQPGRCATIVQDPKHRVWGVAYKIPRDKIEQVKENLDAREKGYKKIQVNFYPRDNPEMSIVITLYVVIPDSPYYGPGDENEIAQIIYSAQGKCGKNIEYLLNTAEYVRRHIPEDDDGHLFLLENLVKQAGL
ncbi:unnamed protein product [Clavelina lepadiformis]|uniref:glutathione-specific gamma-glutamylcyclotransferase n=1 Tax=Clavelina lepadiformis TaxID=159417 RepID=A0ABP0GP00_CLALP